MGDFDDLTTDPLEAEAAVLSAILLEADALPRVLPILSPRAFYAGRHQLIFEAARDLFDEGLPVDAVQVATRLRDAGTLVRVGGMAYLQDVQTAVPAVTNVEAYAHVVARKARLRAAQSAARSWLARSEQPTDSEDALVDELEQAVHAVASTRDEIAKPTTMRDAVDSAYRRLQDQHAGKIVIGSPTGLECIDRHTGGLRDGESTILAARPGMGKTGLAMQIAMHVALSGLGVVAFSLEMPNEQIAMRTLCAAASVDVNKTRSAAFTYQDWSKMTEAAARVSKVEHMYLVDRPSTLTEVRGHARARQSDMQRAGVRLGLIVVDYLQLMQPREGIRNREEAVSENARGLKLLAKELACPVLGLSQLNRSVETRTDKHPMLADLRESGAIEEAADCVIGMYRDDYYRDDSPHRNIVDLEFLKFRHGSTGLVRARFEPQTVSFFDLQETDHAA